MGKTTYLLRNTTFCVFFKNGLSQTEKLWEHYNEVFLFKSENLLFHLRYKISLFFFNQPNTQSATIN